MIYIVVWARTQYLCQENQHTAHNPHTPTMKETMNMAKESDPTDVVFHAKNAERLAAAVRGPRRGWYGCVNGWTKGTDWGVEGICIKAWAMYSSKFRTLAFSTRASAMAHNHIPKWRARNDSRAVSELRYPQAGSDMKSKKRGQKTRHEANTSSL